MCINILRSVLSFFFLLCCKGSAEEVVFNFSNTEESRALFPSEVKVKELFEMLESYTEIKQDDLWVVTEERELAACENLAITEEQQFFIFIDGAKKIESRHTYPGYRNYYLPLTFSEKKAMRFILKTLSQESLTSIWSHQSQLEKAGERIAHVHPLAFLKRIFQTEELKVYIQGIKNRGGRVWSEFVGGFKKSFQEEFDIGNVPDDILYDFVQTFNLDISLIYDLVTKNEWENFIKTLIANIQREGSPDKYDQ